MKRDVFNIDVPAQLIINKLYDVLLPEPECHSLPMTRIQAIDNVVGILKTVCEDKWREFDTMLEHNYQLEMVEAAIKEDHR